MLVVGASGQLGSEFITALGETQARVVAADHMTCDGWELLDLACPEEAAARVMSLRPALVINAAAYTAVDQAEQDTARARAVNAAAPGALASACRDIGALMLHVSTDYVFDGRAGRSYTERDPVSPLNEYGRSKAAGEQAVMQSGSDHFVVRTSGLYTPGGGNFVATMLRLFARPGTVRVVDDQHVSPTCARHLARAITGLFASTDEATLRGLGGLYHLCAQGETTWYGFARAIHQCARPQPVAELVATDTASYGAPAARPVCSVLDCSLAAHRLGIVLPPWRAQLESVMEEFNGIARDDG